MTDIPVCVGTIVLRDGACLMVRQVRDGKWSIPWGFLDEGETPAAGAARETLEESGVHVEITGLAGVQFLTRPAGGLGIVFTADVLEGEPTHDGEETDAAAFVSLTDLQTVGPIDEWCRWLVARALSGDLDALPQADGNPYVLPGYF